MARKKSKDDEPKKEGYPIWKGYISFGLVNIPVIMYSAEIQKEEVHFKLLDKNNLAGIKYKRINLETGKEVAWEDIVKGYEYEAGNYVILTDEDLNDITRENLKSIEIEDFFNLDELGTLYFEKPYYLIPDKRGDKGYVLLRETLKKTNKVGITRLMIRSHQYLAVVLAQDCTLIINTIRYPQEVKKPSEIAAPKGSLEHYKISKKELDIAKKLVDSMTVKWDSEKYINEYRKDLMKLIDKKIASGGKKAIKHIEKTKIKQTNVVDFMSLLKKSLSQKKNGKTNPSKTSTSKKGAKRK